MPVLPQGPPSPQGGPEAQPAAAAAQPGGAQVPMPGSDLASAEAEAGEAAAIVFGEVAEEEPAATRSSRDASGPGSGEEEGGIAGPSAAAAGGGEGPAGEAAASLSEAAFESGLSDVATEASDMEEEPALQLGADLGEGAGMRIGGGLPAVGQGTQPAQHEEHEEQPAAAEVPGLLADIAAEGQTPSGPPPVQAPPAAAVPALEALVREGAQQAQREPAPAQPAAASDRQQQQLLSPQQEPREGASGEPAGHVGEPMVPHEPPAAPAVQQAEQEGSQQGQHEGAQQEEGKGGDGGQPSLMEAAEEMERRLASGDC
jgi:hypothetical protein